ncbi:3'(2'),5'-bisphosphate nucleotidase [Candidatus Blochmanniella vafra str. BVAF]|uniref:3'(2'),5'-bisphosphate nucleotidase CysQ n=1 Tax=Blochmanniella vafra (strain BVAF) TaxID=859654 RepID=E8Q6Q6_BLOVB|nr:3'(2'),5'-bisphosphate nucleotidase CysQ [Candidatus Blochmannia vafer]ADV33497.1 3'(2'),5'-bisphosphate nucleotidase [Candidatus Blochmannia vafer str. BVAF]
MIDQISYIARIAGSEIMKVYSITDRMKINVRKKIDQSFVTNADLFSNQIIVSFLQKLTPNIPIISEENLPEWEECKKWNCFWLVDPLDGTKEFLSRNGEFTVNIAFVEYGEPVMGVVYVPVYNILYAASNNRAWKVNSIGQLKLLNVISNKLKIYKNPIIVMSRSKITDYQQKLLDNYVININNYKIINIGSSFKFCLIAEGIAQFYPRFSYTKIWDTAAGHAVAKSAGAFINDWNGYPLNYKYINEYFLNPGFQVSLYL